MFKKNLKSTFAFIFQKKERITRQERIERIAIISQSIVAIGIKSTQRER
jgi:hypothetical protein